MTIKPSELEHDIHCKRCGKKMECRTIGIMNSLFYCDVCKVHRLVGVDKLNLGEVKVEK